MIWGKKQTKLDLQNSPPGPPGQPLVRLVRYNSSDPKVLDNLLAGNPLTSTLSTTRCGMVLYAVVWAIAPLNGMVGFGMLLYGRPPSSPPHHQEGGGGDGGGDLPPPHPPGHQVPLPHHPRARGQAGGATGPHHTADIIRIYFFSNLFQPGHKNHPACSQELPLLAALLFLPI